LWDFFFLKNALSPLSAPYFQKQPLELWFTVCITAGSMLPAAAFYFHRQAHRFFFQLVISFINIDRFYTFFSLSSKYKN